MTRDPIPAPASAAAPDPSPGSGSVWRSGLLAGLLGGGLTGALDGSTAAAVSSGVGPKAGLVAVLGLGVGALVGLAGVAGFVALRGLVARLFPRLAGARATALAAILLAAPLVHYDAFALFGGRRASLIPGRNAISWALVVLGLAAVGWLARAAWRLLDRLLRGETSVRRGYLAALGFGLGGVAAYAANRVVLPRLYGWFHDVLSLAGLIAFILCARTALAVRVPAGLRPRALIAAMGLAGLAMGLGLFAVGRSHPLLFVAHEDAILVGPVMRHLPLRPPEHRAAIVEAPTGDTPPAVLPDGPRRPEADVILVTVDALRADHVGAYGYGRPTTPSIDRAAARGVRFERAYTQAPHTSFAVTSMLTGKYYPTLARVKVPDGRDTLPLALRQYGWKTAAFYPPAVFFVDGDKIEAYRRDHFGFEYVKEMYIEAEGRVDQIITYFTEVKPERAFVWVHFFEPHEPYEPHPGFAFGPRAIDRYDSEIAYTDAAIGRLLDYLEQNRPGAIVIISADHGEEFDEHGGRYHGSSLFDEQVRVPLVMVVPEVSPRVIPGPVELVDVTPTVLGLLDIPVPVRIRGTDLGPWLADPPAAPQWLPPVFGEVEEQRMVVRAQEKLICDIRAGYCSFYDLAQDPREARNQIDARPEAAARLRAELDRWLADNTRFEADPAAAPDSFERARLGDPSAAEDLKRWLEPAREVGLRRQAARLLVMSLPPLPATRAAVLRASRDPDPEVRAFAAVAAGRLGATEVLPELERLAAAGADAGIDPALLTHAALARVPAGAQDPAVALAQALAVCGDVPLCRRVIRVLGRLEDRRATPALIAHLWEVRNRAEVIAALGQIADPAALPELGRRLVRDPYVDVRVAAAAALGEIGTSAARRVLRQAARRESEPAVADAIAAALAGSAETRAADAPSSPPAEPDPPVR